MVKIPHLDKLLIRITPKDIPGEKLAPVYAVEDFQLEWGQIALGKEISSSLHSRIISILQEHQDTFV